MEKKHLIWIIGISIIVGGLIGMGIYVFVEDNLLMKGYDLYHCIYNNADANGFSENPLIITKIQDECICFREHNYKGLLEANC